MKIAIVTAGGAGMFCGLLHARQYLGQRDLLQRDTTSHFTHLHTNSSRRRRPQFRACFSGWDQCLHGIEISSLASIAEVDNTLLDSPSILKLASKISVSNNAKDLGELTIASLQGADGPQDREVEELIDYLVNDLHPEVICFSNILQTGAVKSLRKRFNGKIFCVLKETISFSRICQNLINLKPSNSLLSSEMTSTASSCTQSIIATSCPTFETPTG